jgi:hypothetical protein
MAGFSVETVAAAKFFSINGDDQALEGRMEIAHVLSYPAMEECGPMMAKMSEKQFMQQSIALTAMKSNSPK